MPITFLSATVCQEGQVGLGPYYSQGEVDHMLRHERDRLASGRCNSIFMGRTLPEWEHLEAFARSHGYDEHLKATRSAQGRS